MTRLLELDPSTVARPALDMIIDRYGSSRVAELTADNYRRAIVRGPAAQAAAAAARLTQPGQRVRVVVPEGNLLADGSSVSPSRMVVSR